MRSIAILLFFIIASLCNPTSLRADTVRIPWSWDMTPDQVRSLSNFGPYRDFSNGDLETYRGIYNGKEENFQFYFQDNKLWRIGVYLSEGSNIAKASARWLSLYDSLTRDFGQVETSENSIGASAEARSQFVAKAEEIARRPGKSQMAPLSQPNDALIFASFYGKDFKGQRIYEVVLYFSKRP